MLVYQRVADDGWMMAGSSMGDLQDPKMEVR